MMNLKPLTILRRLLYVFITIVILLFATTYFLQRWLEYNIEDLINADEDRAYNVSYKDLDLNPFFKGFKLEEVSITPLNKFTGTIITCKINKIVVDGLNWRELAANGNALIKEISFVSPDFELTIAANDTSQNVPSKDVQEFFGDILSRVQVKNFRLVEGSILLNKGGQEKVEIGHVGKVDFYAKDIETDSLQWKYMIPFKTSEFSSSLEDIYYKVDEHSSLSIASVIYLPQESSINLTELSLDLNKSFYEISKTKGEQKDLLAIKLESVSVNGLATKNHQYGSLDVQSRSVIIDGLDLWAYKNKNLPVYNERRKPMFSKMIAAIPFDINIDTILIKNTIVKYTELANGKDNDGTITLNKMNGSIYGFSTIDSIQRLNKSFTLNVSSRLNNKGNLNMNLNVPYDKDAFKLKAKLTKYPMKTLNTTIKPMLGVVIESGNLNVLDFDMKASSSQSTNKMIFQYDNLKLTVLDDNKEYSKKRGLISSVANTMIREENLPNEKRYAVANYSTKRNVYRGPFNLIWFSIQDGLKEIILSKMAKELLEQNDGRKNNSKKGKSKRRKKN